MVLLLDTHVLVWALDTPGRLPVAVRREIEDPLNVCPPLLLGQLHRYRGAKGARSVTVSHVMPQEAGSRR